MVLRFLFISATLPTAKTGCGKRTLGVMSQIVEAGHKVTLFCPSASKNHSPLDEHTSWRVAKSASSLESQYDILWAMDNWGLDALNWSVRVIGHARVHLGIKVVVEDNCDFLRRAKAHLAKTDLQRYAGTIRAEQLWELSDMICCVNTEVARQISRADPSLAERGKALMVLPLALDKMRPIPFHNQRAPVVYLPGSSHHLNYDGMRWFCEKVWSHIAHALPKISLRIVGRGTEVFQQVPNLPQGIEVIGTTHDLSSEIAKGLLCAIPALAPGGLKTAVLDSLTARTPVITHPQSIHNLGLEAGPGILPASRPAEYAARIVNFIASARDNAQSINEHLCDAEAKYEAANNFQQHCRAIIKALEQKVECPSVINST